MKPKASFLVRSFDWIAFIVTIILMVFGLIMLYSIALGSSDPGDMLNFQKQILFVSVGIVVYLFFAFVDYRVWNNWSLVLYGFGIVMLVLVLFLGTTIRGTTGWFDFGLFSLQPVELIKVVLIIFLARYMTHKAVYIRQLKYLVASAVGVMVLVGLVLLQPDFGSAALLMAVWLGLVLLTGIKRMHLAAMVAGFMASLAVLWFFVFQEYQKNRIMVFLDPSRDPLGVGYNVTQAIIAVGSGKLFGRGLSFGSQSKLKFLPEAQTDFIFAVIAEQLGFLGVVIVVTLFGLLLWRLLSVAKQTRDNFGLYLLAGIIIILFTQIFINIGMNVGLLPVTGVTLPLISYGGSSLLATLILLGIAQSVAMRGR